jgi:hypothetical protein
MRYRNAKLLEKNDVVKLYNSKRLHWIMDTPKEFICPLNATYFGFAKKRLVFMVLDSNGETKYVDHLEIMNPIEEYWDLREKFKKEISETNL